jgi:hypothetical protein
MVILMKSQNPLCSLKLVSSDNCTMNWSNLCHSSELKQFVQQEGKGAFHWEFTLLLTVEKAPILRGMMPFSMVHVYCHVGETC